MDQLKPDKSGDVKEVPAGVDVNPLDWIQRRYNIILDKHEKIKIKSSNMRFFIQKYGIDIIPEKIWIDRIYNNKKLIDRVHAYVTKILQHIVKMIDMYIENEYPDIAERTPERILYNYNRTLLPMNLVITANSYGGGTKFTIDHIRRLHDNINSFSLDEMTYMMYRLLFLNNLDNFQSTVINYPGIKNNYLINYNRMAKEYYSKSYEEMIRSGFFIDFINMYYVSTGFINKLVVLKNKNKFAECIKTIKNPNYLDDSYIYGGVNFQDLTVGSRSDNPLLRVQVPDRKVAEVVNSESNDYHADRIQFDQITFGRNIFMPDIDNLHYKDSIKNNKQTLAGLSGTTVGLIPLLNMFDIGEHDQYSRYCSIIALICNTGFKHHSIDEVLTTASMIYMIGDSNNLEQIFKYNNELPYTGYLTEIISYITDKV